MAFGCISSKSTTAKSSSKDAANSSAHHHAHKKASASKGGASKTATGMHSAEEYIDAISKRRSVYALGNELPKSHKEVTKIIEDTIRQCPSSFNVQSSRVVILYGDEHRKVWEIVKDALKKVTKEDQYAASEMKVNSCFLAGAGTILFYEDSVAIKGQQQTYPPYAEAFPTFSQHSSGIAQFAVWSALAQDNIGASLQHYNQLIEAQLREAFDVPEHWELIAQMPFGSIEKAPDAKTYIPDENRFVVLDE